MATVADLTYPVLMSSRDNSVTALPGADAIGRCNAIAFHENRFYDNLA